MNTVMKIVLVAVTLSGCKKNPLQPSETRAFYPLTRGNTWSYVVSPNLLRGQDSIDVQTVVRDTVIDAQTWSFLTYTYGNPRNRFGMWYRNSDQGLWMLYSPSPVLYYRYPCQPGDTYPGPAGIDTIRVVSTQLQLSVPAGTFTCILYERSITQYFSSGPFTFYTDSYVSPGTGEVKTEFYSADSTKVKYLSSTHTLIAYSIK